MGSTVRCQKSKLLAELPVGRVLGNEAVSQFNNLLRGAEALSFEHDIHCRVFFRHIYMENSQPPDTIGGKCLIFNLLAGNLLLLIWLGTNNVQTPEMHWNSRKTIHFGGNSALKETRIAVVVAMTGLPVHEPNSMNIAHSSAVDGEHIHLIAIPVGVEIDLWIEQLVN